MKEDSSYWQAWEQCIRSVFPFSDAIAPDDLCFSEKDGRPVLSIHSHPFFVEFVRKIKNSHWLAPPETSSPVLYFTEWVSPKQAEELRKSNTPFIDMRGNAFISLPGIYLFVAGRRKENPFHLGMPQRPSGKLFRKSGIKLIYLFLSDPRLDKAWRNAFLNRSIREIASEVGLSVGTVSELLSEMKERGFLLSDGRFRRLVNRKDLFEQWVRGYVEYRFKMKRQCFKAKTIRWWEKYDLAQEGFRWLWGGEPAASLLTDDYLHPSTITIYTKKLLYDLIAGEDLQQVPAGGNVEWVEPFPHARFEAGKNATLRGCVHPLLVYADLISSSDDRNREAAARIYEQYLQSIIQSA